MTGATKTPEGGKVVLTSDQVTSAGQELRLIIRERTGKIIRHSTAKTLAMRVLLAAAGVDSRGTP